MHLYYPKYTHVYIIISMPKRRIKFMKKGLKAACITAAGVAGITALSAEAITYLLSHKKANLDFLFKNDKKPSEAEISLKKSRLEDRRWVLMQGLSYYTITSSDALKLNGYLLKADVPTDKYVFCIHGYRATGIAEFDSIARFYHNLGLNVFMIDQRSCGDSEGTYITYGAKEQEDCMLWLKFMLATFGKDIKIILHGVSLGSATVMMMCGNKLPDNVKFAICDCGYATAKSQLTHNFCQYKVPADLAYNLFRHTCKVQEGYDPSDVNPVTAMENCQVPVIFAHGEDDDFVPYQMVYAVYDACASDKKKLIIVPGATHAKAFFTGCALKNEITKWVQEMM